ncbi:Replicase polyprotein 1ab [Micromonospora sp. FIMYZ51]|uniref:tetratricopeptide repeat protein n=1 Tax=Micromonospora sp. FIMYZ51 TaxID=3051832 RepID=UPI00311D2D39
MARHLVATGQLIDEAPAEALAHALAARRLAARIAAVREAVGLAAYHAGEWQTAIAELRTYHRMSGVQSHLAVIADSERALGRPERAIDLFRGADRETLDRAVAIELLIVAAGARGDLGQRDAAVAMLQVPELTTEATEPWTARLRYAYADALLAVGRRTEAREWFSRAAEVDADAETDAAERLLELDGVVIEGDEDDEVVEELTAGPGTPGAVPAQPDADLSGDVTTADEPTETDAAATAPTGNDAAEDDAAEDDATEDDAATLAGNDATEGDTAPAPTGDETTGDAAAPALARDDVSTDSVRGDDAIEEKRTEGDPATTATPDIAAVPERPETADAQEPEARG